MIFLENPHPVLIHFPIALLMGSLALEVLALIRSREKLEQAARCLLYLGTLGAGAAVLSGLRAAGLAPHSFEIHEIMETHETLGFWVLGLSAALSLWQWFRPHWKPIVRKAVLLIAVGILARGAHLGGRMVYEFGVGTQIYDKANAIQVVP